MSDEGMSEFPALNTLYCFSNISANRQGRKFYLFAFMHGEGKGNAVMHGFIDRSMLLACFLVNLPIGNAHVV